GLSFVAMAVLGVLSMILVARVYGIAVVGEYALVLAPVSAVAFLSSLRERAAFVRELATLEPRAPRVTALFVAMLAFSAALTAVVAAVGIAITYVLFAGPIGQPDLFEPAVLNMASFLMLGNTAWNFDAVLSGFRAGRQLFGIRLHQAAAFLAFAVVVGLAYGTVWALVAANIAASGTSLVHRVASARTFMRAPVSAADLREGFRTLPEMIRFGLKIVPGTIANGVTNEVGTWVLGSFGTVTTVGAYNRAWMLGRRLVDMNWTVTEMLFPTLVERRRGGDREGFDRAIAETIRYCAMGLLLPAAAAGGAASGVMALFGPGFAVAADALALLLLMPAVLSIAAVLRTALLAVDRPLTSSVLALVGSATTVAAVILLTLWLGVTGTALGMVAGAVFGLGLLALVIRPHLEQPVLRLVGRRELGAVGLAFGAGFGAARTAQSVLEGPIGLVPALLAGTAAYVAVLWVAGGINQRDRRRATTVAAGLRSRLPRRSRTTRQAVAAATRRP
ncbi:MAG: oligosaccharide flippase family protein, partial [Thermoleophilaceae bacterium]